MSGIFQSNKIPGITIVSGFNQSEAGVGICADICLARAAINHIAVIGVHAKSADRKGGKIIGQRDPADTPIRCAKNPAGCSTGIDNIRVGGIHYQSGYSAPDI